MVKLRKISVSPLFDAFRDVKPEFAVPFWTLNISEKGVFRRNPVIHLRIGAVVHG